MIGLLAVAAAIMAAYPSGDPDVFFHLAVGRDVVESGRLPDTEPFCLASEGRPFRNHEWGFDVLLWLAHDAAGPAGVTLFKAGLAACLFALVALVGVRVGASTASVTALGVLFLPLFRGDLEARPHLAGYALAAGAVLALDGLLDGRRACLAWFAAIMVVWANVHGSFVLGVVLWGAMVAASLVLRRPSVRWPLLAAGPVAALATLLNPWGLGLWAVVLHHAEPAYRDLVPEWKPVAWGDVPVADTLYLLLVGVALLSFLPRPNRLRVDRLALLGVFLLPAILATKFTLGLAVGAVPVLAANLSGLAATSQRWVRLLAWGAAVVSALFAPPHLPPWSGPGLGLDLRDHPAAATRLARTHGVAGRVFAPLHEGGYIAYAGHPDLRPFIDGRAYVHGLEGIRRYLGALADYKTFQDLHAAVRFDLVIADLLDFSFPRLIAGLAKDPAFALVHLDDRYAVFVPEARRPTDLAPYRVVRPSTDPRYLAALPDEALPETRIEVDRVLAVPEGQTLGLLLRGVLRLREAGVGSAPEAWRASRDSASCATAAADLGALVRRRPDVPMFRHFHAKALACAGRCGEARTEAARAAPHFPDARRLGEALELCSGSD